MTAGVKGIIFAGVGDGNVSSKILEGLKEVADKGIKVVISSRTGSGIVYRDSEYNFESYDFIAASNLSPQKARILLMLALTNTSDTNKIQEYFYLY